MIRPLALALSLCAAPVAAQQVVEVPGLLSDDAFYNAVACAAPPGGACRAPIMRWDATRPIRVALRPIDPAYLGRRAKVAESAVTLAIRSMNAAEAGVRLAAVPADEIAEIEIWFLGLDEGAPITGTGIDGVDGVPLGPVSTRLLFNHDTGRIERAAIVVSAALETIAFEPAMLTALTRAMGLMSEIDSPAYTGISVLAAGNTAAAALGPQDIQALKRHYARN